jgi:hypothetical protein
MRKIFCLIVLITILCSVYAQSYNVYLHEINIDVINDGRASVVERFYLFFPNEEEKVTFRNLSTNLGSDITKWAELNPIFQPNIGNQNLINKQISYTESETTYLELRYTLADVLMAKGKQNPNNTEYTLKATALDNFFETNVWVIPENTELIFTLPSRAEVFGTVEPEAQISGDGTKTIVKWTGYKSANRLNLKYLVWNPPTIEINEIIDNIFYTFEGQIFIVIIVLSMVFILIERKKISAKIEDYVADNSKITEGKDD